MTTLRPVGPGDAEPVLGMWHRHQTAVLGHPDSTLDDARDQLSDPDLDPGSVVALDADGRVVGCALAYTGTGSGLVDLDVVADPVEGAALLAALLEHATGLAVAAARARGLPSVRVDQSAYRGDDLTAGVLRGAGFAVATTFHRMRRELDEPVDVVVPSGVALERADEEDDSVLRRAHRLHTATFAGHFGFEPREYDEWLEVHRSRATRTGPTWFATVDGEDAGLLMETDQFVADEDAGYVQRLGVLRSARGRGVARALLAASFAGMRERGRRAAVLHVDSANATGATRLYESVGMRAVLVLDAWRAERPVGAAAGPGAS